MSNFSDGYILFDPCGMRKERDLSHEEELTEVQLKLNEESKTSQEAEKHGGKKKKKKAQN